MVWTAFEIAINCVQGLLILMFVKQCFAYEKQHPVADAALVLSCAGLLTFLLSRHMLFVDQLLYVFPAIYALTLSSERKTSIVYWLIVMTLLFNMISVVTYPIFELLPQITHMPFPSVQVKRFVSIIVTNIALFAVLKLLIQIKKGCSVPGTSSYAAFMITLSAAFLVEESLYSLFLNVSDETIVPFFWAYIGLIVFTMMTVLLFRMVSMDADRKNRYQTEIAMLSLTRQHQQELSQMYEDLTQRQHDYKHHLQTLQELVTGSGESTAKAYLETVLKDTDAEDMIVTGNPGVDALLDALGRFVDEPARGAEFGAHVFKIARDEKGARLTFLKVTGGTLTVKQTLSGEGWEEKADQLRLYSGSKFTLLQQAPAGTVCAVTGLTKTMPGMTLGHETAAQAPVLQPVLEYRLLLEDGTDAALAYGQLRVLEEEDPALHLVWNALLREIRVQLMGPVQMEILQRLMRRLQIVQNLRQLLHWKLRNKIPCLQWNDKRKDNEPCTDLSYTARFL